MFAPGGHDIVVLSRHPPTYCPGSARWVHLGRRHARRLGERDRRRGRRHQPRGTQRQLPLQRGEPRDHPATRASQSTRVVGQAIAAARGPRASGSRRAPRRSTRIASTRRTTRRRGSSAATSRRAGDLAVQHRGREGLGAARSTQAAVPRTRKVTLRSAMVMSPDRGGIFDALLGLVRPASAGGGRRTAVRLLDPRGDFVRAVAWLIEHEESRPVNLAAPNPLPNADFMRALREAWGVRLDCRRRDGCSRSARSSCAPSPSCPQEPPRRPGRLPAASCSATRLAGGGARPVRAVASPASRRDEA